MSNLKLSILKLQKVSLEIFDIFSKEIKEKIDTIEEYKKVFNNVGNTDTEKD